MPPKTAIIIGAGPAGLTAAYELLEKTDIKPVIYEMSEDIGGISKTVDYKGNKIDMGGHRFFSKSDRVVNWWLNVFPLEDMALNETSNIELKEFNNTKTSTISKSKTTNDKVMLLRNRISRILFLGKFFDYPLSINLTTLTKLGFIRTAKIILSYSKVRFFPIKDEKSLEDFFINRFGRELYFTFFKDYTEKVWGVSCSDITPEWGAQRVKGVSFSKTIVESLKNTFNKSSDSDTETSLIRSFMYPKFGPGQFWEEIAKISVNKGAKLHLNHRIIGFITDDDLIVGVKVKDELTGEIKHQKADYFISTMPIKELIRCVDVKVPEDVLKVSEGLLYRDFLTVGILTKKLKNDSIPDNWIYVQEKEVEMGRIQIFNNWSPYLVSDPQKTWLGIEYFCNEGDELWEMSNEKLIKLASEELATIGMIDTENIIDGVAIRMEKAYPAYFGTYGGFDTVKNYLEQFENLFLIGRNGMHRYNNMDHSMLTAMEAVNNIIEGKKSKENIWDVNSEEDYHET